jgi:hypothetical protein
MVYGAFKKPHWMIRTDDEPKAGLPRIEGAACSVESTTVIVPPGSIVIVMPLGDSAGKAVLKAVRRGFAAAKTGQ